MDAAEGLDFSPPRLAAYALLIDLPYPCYGDLYSSRGLKPHQKRFALR